MLEDRTYGKKIESAHMREKMGEEEFHAAARRMQGALSEEYDYLDEIDEEDESDDVV